MGQKEMEMGKVKTMEGKVSELVQDDKNFNKGSSYGKQMLDHSMGKFGAGRSVLVDKNNRIIAGNQATSSAIENGIENALIVETDGNTLVVVKRTDIDLDSKKGRELALADNATGKNNLTWDAEQIEATCKEFDIMTEDWGIFRAKVSESDGKSFEEQINEITDADCELAIVPQFNERHEIFIIPVHNEIDEGFIRDLFDLNKNHIAVSGDGKVRKTNVIGIEALRRLVE